MRVLFVGDSITNGAGASSLDRSYPALLVAALRRGHGEVLAANESQGGRTAPEALPLVRSLAQTLMPEIAVVCFGANDQKPVTPRLRRGRRRRPCTVSPADFEYELGRVAWLIRAASVGCQVVIVSPPALPPYRGRGYCDACERVCERDGLVFVDATTGYDRAWIAADGAHPDDRGHAFIAARVLEHLNHDGSRAPGAAFELPAFGRGEPAQSVVGV